MLEISAWQIGDDDGKGLETLLFWFESNLSRILSPGKGIRTMAKLSANGTELARIDDDGIERVCRYSVRSNGWILVMHKWRESSPCRWNISAWTRYARHLNDSTCINSWTDHMIKKNGFKRVN